MDHLGLRTPEGVLKQATGAREGRTRPANLREQVDPATVEIYKEASWATPQNRDWKNPDPVNDRWTDPSRTKGLPEQLVHLEKWATPQEDNANNWGTPSVTVTGGPTGLGGGSGNKRKMQHFGEECRAMCSAKLNPDWVCTLMGIPVGWVSVNNEGKNRIDELRLLGNGVVPQTAELAFRTLIKELSK
jgi:hypothetical protein